ncbi:MAG: hypothetical protein WC523_02085 [Patescibacteria group bacterium]
MLTGLKIEKLLKSLIFIGLLALVVIIFSQKIEFTSVDLGRHLENGKIVWQNQDVLFKNFYSYTEPDFRFVNHHWLGGVIFYAVYLAGGFKLLSVFNILIILAAFVLAFRLAQKRAGFYLTALLAIPAIFLLSQRVEIRPEIFSYLFIILTWLILEKAARRQNYRLLWWLAPLFVVWANIHIYFFIGLVMFAAQVFAEFLPPLIKEIKNLKIGLRAGWRAAKPWFIKFIIVALACLINPNTWRGLLYPFNIFKNYGYEVAENKTVFYLEHLMINPNFSLFKILLFLLILSWLAYFVFQKKIRFFDLFLTVFFSLLALFASRNLAIFGLIAWILIAANLVEPWHFLKDNLSFLKPASRAILRLYLAIAIFLIIIIGLVYLIFDARGNNNFIKSSWGWGLYQGNANSAQFFKENKLSGPILNNYDVGSALIFWLDGQEKVFVDNRPEAYSPEFFAATYRPLQTDQLKWQAVNEKYQFKTIYFSHVDSTPWAQQFLSRILKDDNWALVYFDEWAVILLNKQIYSAEEIKKLTIDSWSFRQKFRGLDARTDLRNKFHLAALAEEAGQPDLAEEIYREILIKDPDNSQALAALGYLYANRGDREALLISLKYLAQSLATGYKIPGIYNQMALDNWQLGEYQKAEANWRSALKLERNNNSAVYYLEQIRQLKLQGVLPDK